MWWFKKYLSICNLFWSTYISSIAVRTDTKLNSDRLNDPSLAILLPSFIAALRISSALYFSRISTISRVRWIEAEFNINFSILRISFSIRSGLKNSIASRPYRLCEFQIHKQNNKIGKKTNEKNIMTTYIQKDNHQIEDNLFLGDRLETKPSNKAFH